VAALEFVGLASAALCPMVKWLNASKESNVHAVLVVRHGTPVPISLAATTRGAARLAISRLRHDKRSVTKSVIALLSGIAIDRGLIKGIDGPGPVVLSGIHRYADARKDVITLRHVFRSNIARATLGMSQTTAVGPQKEDVNYVYALPAPAQVQIISIRD
jgi:hypothetical protein